MRSMRSPKRGVISKSVIRVVYCAAVFLIALFLLSSLMNRGNTDMTMEMAPATFPSVAFEYNGMIYNRMHGYGTEMDISRMRSLITPLGEDRKLTLAVDTYGRDIAGLRFQVRSLADKRLIEDTEVNNYVNGDEHITADIVLKDLLEEDREYSLCVIIKDEGNREIYFYTTLYVKKDTAFKDKLEFVYNFNELTFDRSGEAQKLVTYLESNEEGDNSTYQKVNIHSSLDQICWGTLKVSRLTKPEAEIFVNDEDTAVIKLNYIVTVPENDKTWEFYVNESFRLRPGEGRMFLLDYERTMDQIFDTEEGILANNKIVLGISDKNVNMMESEDGDRLAFVNAGRLYVYHISENRLAYVFGFYNDDLTDRRETCRDNDIRIFSVDETGNVRFIVYGYMNCGIHEGENGISVYYYDSTLNSVEEEVFIPYYGACEFLNYDVARQAYANGKKNGYFYIDGNFYNINLETGETSVIASGLAREDICAAEDGSMVAWIDSGDRFDAMGMHLLNAKTGTERVLNAESGDRIMPVGFFGNDVIYGLAAKKDITVDASGHTVFPMYCLRIRDESGDLIKEYRNEGIYVTQVEAGNGIYTLKRAKYENGTLIPVSDDRLLDNSTPEYGRNSIELAVTDAYETITQIALKKATDPDTLRIMNPKQIVYEGERRADLYDKENDKEKYFCYERGSLVDIYDELYEAVNTVKDSGLVRCSGGITLYRKKPIPEKNQIMAIDAFRTDDKWIDDSMSPEEYSLTVCLDTVLYYEGKAGESAMTGADVTSGKTAENILSDRLPDIEIADLSGCTIDEMLFYLAQDIPVLVKTGDAYVMLTGYNNSELVVADPLTGEIGKRSKSDCEALFASSGNRFLTYVSKED